MSLCPPGSVFNPQTLRCVKAGGRLGKRLQTPALTRRQSNNYQISYPRQSVPFTRVAPIPIYDAVPQLAQAITRSVRQSRIPILAPDLARGMPARGTPFIFGPAPTTRGGDPCPDGKILNPVTGKCVKVGGRVQRRIQRGPSNEAYDARAPMIYTRKASKIPISTPESMRTWISSQCANTEEPFTGKNLKAMTEEEMGTLIKTSAGTCLRAEYLDRHIRHEREKGREVMDPLNPRRQLTLSNMDILGRTIRQVVPDYRIPQHTRRAMGDKLPTRGALPVPAPTPAATFLRTRVTAAATAPAPDLTQRTRITATSYPENWKFFIGKDARSGNDFYSVYYYDKDMATVTNDGVKIPTQAIVIDIGIIPAFVGVVESGNPACTTSTLVEKLLALHKKQKLLHKLGNQLVATIELPGERARWKTPDGAIQRKFFQQVCQYLEELAR